MNISSKQNGVRIILAIITGIYVCAFMPACLLALGINYGYSITSLVIYSYPIIIAGSMALAWRLYRSGKFSLALLVTLLPIIYFIGTHLFVPGL